MPHIIDRTKTGMCWRGDGLEPLDVDALYHTDTHRVVRLTCGSQQIDVYVSPTGRSMRVFRKHIELKEDDRG